MALSHQLANRVAPWDLIRQVITQHTDDPLLQTSLFNMLTLRHRFDHFQYVACVQCHNERLLLTNPLVAQALAYLSKIKYAITYFPRFYQQLWNQVKPIFMVWEKRLSDQMDAGLALQLLHPYG